MAYPEAGLGGHLHAGNSDSLGPAESRFRLDVRGAAVIRVSCPGDVVLSALAVRTRSSADAVHLERLLAAIDVSARHRPRDLRRPRQRCDAVSPSCHATRPDRRALWVGVDGQLRRDDVFLFDTLYAGCTRLAL